MGTEQDEAATIDCFVPSQSVKVCVKVTLSYYMSVMVQAMIAEPLLFGAIHWMLTLEPSITVVGATGLSGIQPARIETGVEYALKL